MSDSTFDRRRLFGAGAAAIGAAALLAAPARARPADGGWTPTAEPQDQWMDRPGTRHRLLFDTLTASGANGAIGYARNFLTANQAAYGLAATDLAVIIVLRHASVAYGFNDAIWRKYGKQIAAAIELDADEAKKALKGNPLLAARKGKAGDEEISSMAKLASKGVVFAICEMATEGAAFQLAEATKGDAKAIEAELRANLVPGGRLVSAGIVAVNRAQEKGYAFAFVP